MQRVELRTAVAACSTGDVRSMNIHTNPQDPRCTSTSLRNFARQGGLEAPSYQSDRQYKSVFYHIAESKRALHFGSEWCYNRSFLLSPPASQTDCVQRVPHNLPLVPCLVSYHTWQGCALDFFTNNELHENDEARLSMDRYMSRRNGRRRPRATSTPFSAGARKQACTNPSSHASRDGKSKPDESEEKWTDDHVSVLRGIVFETLAGLAWDALKAQRAARQLDSPKLRQLHQPSSHPSAESVNPKNPSSEPSPIPLLDCGDVEASARQNSPSTNSGKGPWEGDMLSVKSLLGAKRNADSAAYGDPVVSGGVGGVGGGGGVGDDGGGFDGGGGGAAGGAVADTAGDAVSASVGADAAVDTGFCGNERVASEGGVPLLFNEQYVVKPPRSSIEFGWHTVSFDNSRCSKNTDKIINNTTQKWRCFSGGRG